VLTTYHFQELGITFILKLVLLFSIKILPTFVIFILVITFFLYL